MRQSLDLMCVIELNSLKLKHKVNFTSVCSIVGKLWGSVLHFHILAVLSLVKFKTALSRSTV